MKNNILLLFILVFVCLMNCDGRSRVHQTNTQVLPENNLLNAFNEHIKFVPETKVEIVTDTILSNGFQIKIIYNSIENSSVSKTVKTKNNTTSKINYRNFEAKLHILKNGSTINQSVINKKLFDAFENTSFWEAAIMQHVWIDYEASTERELYLNTAFHIPNTKTYKDFVLKIDERGTIQIKENNRSANII
ncbi:hypothetical protein [uncultured Algibacter sp.]|uniref:hypothetical protein n=1 Tax=uncultured Algibacter sp. TaxID=298659 RepID=UPI0030EE852D